jgi:amino acid permease
VAGPGAGSARHSRLSLLVAASRSEPKLSQNFKLIQPLRRKSLIHVQAASYQTHVDALARGGEQGEHTLKRSLGALNLITLGIGAMIGAGIFVLTGRQRRCTRGRRWR